MSVAQRLNEVRKTIADACARAGRDPKDVRLLAVSKLQSAQLIEEAYALGVRDFGENYVQELIEKRKALPHLTEAKWHLIGHLQSNKAKQALEVADFFHALDSEKLARELAKRNARARPWPVFIQVNVDAEATKGGVPPEQVARLAKVVREEPKLKLLGLMGIPEPKSPPERMRPVFRQLAALLRATQISGEKLELSMGMSEDFEVAIEEGAHWIRVGRKLFGERKTS